MPGWPKPLRAGQMRPRTRSWHPVRLAAHALRPDVIRHEKDQIGKEAVMLSPQELNTLLRRLVAGAVALILLLLAGISVSQAAEIIPAVGLSKPVDGDDNGQFFGSLAFRSQFLVPMLKSEIGVGYRQESRFNEQLKIRQWPVTASLYFSPVPVLYAGGGVG